MTMECDYCELPKKNILYEDADVVIAVKEITLTPGQITIFPKQHQTILELVPNAILERCASLANAVSKAVFDSLGCQGTNIIIHNGLSAGQRIPHVALEVVPRREGDGLNLQWQPKKLLEDEMDTAFLLLKEQGERLILAEEEKKKEVIVKKEPAAPLSKKEGKDSYLLKSLRRIP